MSTRIALVLTIGASLGFAASARAAISAFWVPVASGNGSVGTMYEAYILANDPQLASMQTWDLHATTDGDWSAAGMRAVLPPGNFFYKHPLGGFTKPNIFHPPIGPAREFTTYVTAPADNGVTNFPAILGGFPSGEPSLGDPSAPVPGTFSISWQDSITDVPGTYQIARLTFPLGVLPNIINIDDVGAQGSFSFTSQLNPGSTTEIPDIPEPQAARVFPLAALFARQVRRMLSSGGLGKRGSGKGG